MIDKEQAKAIYKLYTNVITIHGDEAFDANNNIVVYNINEVDAEVIRLQAAETAAQQAAESHKANAISKLTVLGLSTDEINALIG